MDAFKLKMVRRRLYSTVWAVQMWAVKCATIVNLKRSLRPMFSMYKKTLLSVQHAFATVGLAVLLVQMFSRCVPNTLTAH